MRIHEEVWAVPLAGPRGASRHSSLGLEEYKHEDRRAAWPTTDSPFSENRQALWTGPNIRGSGKRSVEAPAGAQTSRTFDVRSPESENRSPVVSLAGANSIPYQSQNCRSILRQCYGNFTYPCLQLSDSDRTRSLQLFTVILREPRSGSMKKRGSVIYIIPHRGRPRQPCVVSGPIVDRSRVAFSSKSRHVDTPCMRVLPRLSGPLNSTCSRALSPRPL